MSLTLLVAILGPVLVFVTSVVTLWFKRRTERETNVTAQQTSGDTLKATIQKARDEYELSLLEQGNAMRKEAVDEAKRLREENAELREDIERLNRKVDEQAAEVLDLRREIKKLRDRFDGVVKE